MNTYIVSLLMAFTAGVFAATQGAINAFIGKSTGQFIMIIVVSLIQALSAVFFLLRSGGTLPLHMIPWIIIAGVLGTGIMFGVATSVGNIGALTVFVLLILGQIAASAVIDHFGAFGAPRQPITLQKLGSLLVIMGGIFWLVKAS